jgi:hypothetical protein
MSINGVGRPRNWNLTGEVPNMRASNHWRHKAEIACERHLKAMRLEFGKLALRHGILVSDARLMLMNGEQP